MTSIELTNSRARLAWLAAIPCAVLIGVLIPVSPWAGTGVAVLAVAVGLLALGRAMVEVFFVSLAGLLAGYALMGRGFAYVGVHPVYVGEVVLVLACVALVTALPVRRPGLPHVVILLFMVWGAARTIPYLGTYGMDALRDATVWGYATFALVIALLLTPPYVRRLVGFYGRLAPIMIIWLPILAVIWVAFRTVLPVVPGTDVNIPFLKAGDWGVHLAGAAAFIVAGLHPRRGWRALTEPVVWAFWLVGFVVVASISRAAMLAAATVPAVLLFRRVPTRWMTWIVSGLLLLALVGLMNIEVDVGRARALSVSQLVANFESVVGESDDPALVDSRRWRENWWTLITSYTIDGPYFWEGKGFGVNLADEDGFQAPDQQLRAPHNAHLNLLARSGVPGLTLWLAVQAAFVLTMVRAAVRAARSGSRVWLGLLGWVFVYWLAALLNMSFDVYLEGPQGGILFWCVVGLGLGLASCVNEAVPPEGWLKRDPADGRSDQDRLERLTLGLGR